MSEPVLNAETLPGNACFGCGPDNPDGLHVEVRRDPDDAGRLLGRFEPRATTIGFPGVTHGGAIYTALDCMATWTGMILRGTRAVWVLRSASVTYHRPAMQGRPVDLATTVEESGGEWDAIRVRGEARDADGELLVDGSFKVIPLPAERFREMVGADALPAGWREWLEDGGA